MIGISSVAMCWQRKRLDGLSEERRRVTMYKDALT
jgi:hypothetical protein